ncbi:hypothetical protein [Thermoproteus tenax]|nr:hypothetical protein [Thermoproteus tenax]
MTELVKRTEERRGRGKGGRHAGAKRRAASAMSGVAPPLPKGALEDGRG